MDARLHLRFLDLDDGLAQQHALHQEYSSTTLPLRPWGERIRLGCSFRRFRAFAAELNRAIECPSRAELPVDMIGSGDFHHVSLALLRRQQRPFNLVVLDNHPDWMRGVPLMHCGTWLWHAARDPLVQTIIHIGGNVDFDNYYLPLAPAALVRHKKILVIPAIRRYRYGFWRGVEVQPLRSEPISQASPERIAEVLSFCRPALENHPVYLSIDKDVLIAKDCVVNWDSGHLTSDELLSILRTVIGSASGRVAGIDVVGDWSKVRLQGLTRRLFHWSMHPTLDVNAQVAAKTNGRTNSKILQTIAAAIDSAAAIKMHEASTFDFTSQRG